MIGTSNNPETCWTKTYVEFPGRKIRTKDKKDEYEIKGKPRIYKGDGMVLYATGKDRLFAIAEVTSKEAYRHVDPARWGNYSVDIRYIGNSNCLIKKGTKAHDVDPTFHAVQGGYYEITSDQFKKAAKALGVETKTS